MHVNNLSEEHIINNCIGGKLKSTKLLCRKCNTSFGSSIDKEVDKQLGVYGFLLDISLDRGEHSEKVKLITKTGKEKYVGPGMIPYDTIRIVLSEDKKPTFYVKPKDFESLVAKKKKEMQKEDHQVKYTQYTEEPIGERYFIHSERAREIGEIAFGGIDYYRSITKMCLNYYLYKGYPIQYCSEVRSFVKGDTSNLGLFYYFPTNEIVHPLSEEEVSHIIHIRGDSENGTLYAYIELFNMQNIIIIFSMNYTGENIDDTYCRDVVQNKELSKNIKLRLLRHHLEVLHLESRAMAAKLVVRHDRLLRIVENRHREYVHGRQLE